MKLKQRRQLKKSERRRMIVGKITKAGNKFQFVVWGLIIMKMLAHVYEVFAVF